MRSAAIGASMHSGWGILVAVTYDSGAVTILDRRRIETCDTKIPGSKQPYHYAAELDPERAMLHLRRCEESSRKLTLEAVRALLAALPRDVRVRQGAVLMSNTRQLPPIPQILAAHPLIHAAEGQIYRKYIEEAFLESRIPATAITEKQLSEFARASLGGSAARVEKMIALAGKSLGSPWTSDHKKAALAAACTLKSKSS